jgi:hypothetical protein
VDGAAPYLRGPWGKNNPLLATPERSQSPPPDAGLGYHGKLSPFLNPITGEHERTAITPRTLHAQRRSQAYEEQDPPTAPSVQGPPKVPALDFGALSPGPAKRLSAGRRRLRRGSRSPRSGASTPSRTGGTTSRSGGSTPVTTPRLEEPPSNSASELHALDVDAYARSLLSLAPMATADEVAARGTDAPDRLQESQLAELTGALEDAMDAMSPSYSPPPAYDPSAEHLEDALERGIEEQIAAMSEMEARASPRESIHDEPQSAMGFVRTAPRLEASFDQVDTNADGVIDREEWAT